MTTFRLAQRARGARAWLPVHDLDDRALAALGYELAGPAIVIDHLSREDRLALARLIERRASSLSPAERERLSTILETCPRGRPPPVDLDPYVPEGCGITRDGGRAHALNAAAVLLPQLYVVGLGLPAILWTGGKGIHLDFGDLGGFRHVHLLETVGGMVRTAARAAGIPLLSEARATADRIPGTVYIDDTLYQHSPRSRGCVWQLDGSRRGKRR